MYSTFLLIIIIFVSKGKLGTWQKNDKLIKSVQSSPTSDIVHFYECLLSVVKKKNQLRFKNIRKIYI